MKKVTLVYLLSIVVLSAFTISEGFSTPPKKKSNLEKRMKKQNKKKKKKGDTTCPKIDC